jgi:60 kDa SS-A/Ro ribonucleoprotein
MANRSLFSSFQKALPNATARNEAGGRAYALAPKHALAQLAATGCFEQTFYAKAETQLTQLQELVDTVDDNTFLAKLAVFSRERAFMKDMPAALVAALASRDSELMHRVFDRAIDNGRVLRTLFQMIRSGRFGRKSLSSSLQRAFGRWLNEASVSKLLAASIGRDPTLRDVLRLARPTPINNERRALFGYLTEKAVEKWTPACENDLPAQVRSLMAYRKAESAEEQVEILSKTSVRWDLLADAARGPLVWKAIARQMGPQALRMNLNTLVRHDVFENDKRMVDEVARRIADVDEIKRSRQFPYQFLAAYLNASPDLSHKIKAALHQAAEVACGNVPRLSGPIVIGLDTSGSMRQPVMGRRSNGHQSPMRCIDVASLFAAAILRRNPNSLLIPFDTQAYDVRVDPQDTILSLAERFAQYGGGGTDCSLPLAMVNSSRHKQRFAGCVLVSDNMSWVQRKDSRYAEFFGAMATKVMEEWNRFVQQQRRFQRKHFRAPKLICIDIQPYGTTQAPERDDILNIGGFSDAVFNVFSDFFDDKPNRLVTEVESIEL